MYRKVVGAARKLETEELQKKISARRAIMIDEDSDEEEQDQQTSKKQRPRAAVSLQAKALEKMIAGSMDKRIIGPHPVEDQSACAEWCNFTPPSSSDLNDSIVEYTGVAYCTNPPTCTAAEMHAYLHVDSMTVSQHTHHSSINLQDVAAARRLQVRCLRRQGLRAREIAFHLSETISFVKAALKNTYADVKYQCRKS